MEEFSISLKEIQKELDKKKNLKTIDSIEFLDDDLDSQKLEFSKKKDTQQSQKITKENEESLDYDDSLQDISLQKPIEREEMPHFDSIHHNFANEYGKDEVQILTEEENKSHHILTNSQDVGFVHGLYKASNYKIPTEINVLFALIISFITLFIIWGNTATIDELARGEGKVIPSTKIQKVQYLDGGLISEILVKEGEHVVIGQSLLKIDTTRVMASFDETQENIYSLEAKEVRLKKELNVNYNQKLPLLQFSSELQKNAKQYIQSEQQIFKNKFYERKNNLNIVRLQYLQRKQELKEIKATASQLEKKLILEKKQYNTMKSLVKSGSKSKLELIDKEKEVNQIENDLETTLLSILRTELSIEEAKSLMNEKEQTIKSEVSIELQEIIAEIKKIKSRLITDTDKLDKTTIKSPATGTIKQININTIGAVVQSGVDLMEIVPDSDILFIEAKIDPKDIAFISPDLDVLVKLTAYDFSIYGGLKGKIIEISADSIVDTESKNGKSYYKVVVKTDKNYLEYNNEKLIIIPGMVASVDIVTGEKTIMDFFLKPILKVKQGALHER